jgi:hypothetical protein
VFFSNVSSLSCFSSKRPNAAYTSACIAVFTIAEHTAFELGTPAKIVLTLGAVVTGVGLPFVFLDSSGWMG